jgi:Tfp pilus assembly protein PilP
MKDDIELSQSIAELIRLHDDVLARVFALQTLLQDLALISPDAVERRTEQFRKQFALDLEARLTARQAKTDAAKENQRRQQILDEYEEPQR